MDAEEKERAVAGEGEDTLQEAEARPPWKRIALLAVLVVLLLGIVYVSPLRNYLDRVQELKDMIRGLGMLGPVVMTLGTALLVAVGFSRLVLCGIAGMAMGFWWGLLWAQLGALLGNYGIFVVARVSGGEWMRRYVHKRERLAGLIHKQGITGVILARQLPVPGMLVNLVLGLLALRHRDFLLGTLIGQLPEAIPCTLIGAGAGKASLAKSAWFIGLAIVFAMLVWAGVRWWAHKSDRRRRGDESIR